MAQEQPPPTSITVGSDVDGSCGSLQHHEIERLHHYPSEESITSASVRTTSTTPTTFSDTGTEEVGTSLMAEESPTRLPTSSSGGHRLFRASSVTKQPQPRGSAALPSENHPSSEKKYITPTKSSGGFFFSRSNPHTPPASAPTMKYPPTSRSLFFTSSGRNHNHNTANSINSNVSSDVIASRTAIDVSTATEKGTNAKLPHGLTVSELKQMTKARLQAEASNSNNSHHSVDSSSGMGLMVAVANDTMAYPTSTIMAASTSPTRRSPYPMVYETTSDTWETASVSTTNTSEFLFPSGAGVHHESAVHHEDGSTIPLVRTLSYPSIGNAPVGPTVVGMVNHHPNSHHYGTAMYHHNHSLPILSSHTIPYQHVPPLSDSSTMSNTNRCRAATSSPRLGLATTDVHYPMYSTGDEYPQYPPAGYMTTTRYHGNSTNTASVHEELQFPNEPHRNPSSIIPDQGGVLTGNEGSYYPNGLGNNSLSFESNRCRTSSLPSVLLPTSFERDDTTQNSNHFGINDRSRHSVNQLFAVNEQSSSDKSNVFVAGLSDAFQSPQVSSFPTFYPANTSTIDDTFTSDNNGYGVSSIGQSDSLPPVRYRASTWADAVPNTTFNNNNTSTAASSLLLFGNIGGTAAATAHGLNDPGLTDISDDLESILKLSTTTSSSTSPPMDDYKY